MGNMHYLIFYIFITKFGKGFVSEVALTAPSYVRNGELFSLNCTSTTAPQIHSAEFLLNGRTITNIGSRDGKCFNAITSETCTPLVCHCSTDRRSYNYSYQFVTTTGPYVFACKMKVSGSQMMTSNNVRIDVIDPPQLILDGFFGCNRSGSVTLVCRIHGGSMEFRFLSWKHYFDARLIRQLDGFVQAKLSILQLYSCNFEDTGTYICESWNIFPDGVFITNATTTVEVMDRPVIINKTVQVTRPGLVLCVFIYSTSDMVSLNWFLDTQIIPNSTEHEQHTDNMDVQVTIHGKLVLTKGTKSTLRLLNAIPLQRKYKICASNDYGKVCEDFEGNTEISESENLNWIIGGTVTVVLLMGLITVIVTVHIRHKNQVNTFLPHGGSNQPERVDGTRSSTNVTSRDTEILDVSQYVHPNSPMNRVHSFHRASCLCDRVNSSKTDTPGTPLFNVYLDVEPNSTSSSEESDTYEKVE